MPRKHFAPQFGLIPWVSTPNISLNIGFAVLWQEKENYSHICLRGLACEGQPRHQNDQRLLE